MTVRERGVATMAAALCLVAGILAAATVARADTIIGTVAAPTPVSAFGGRLAWSSFDPATKRYALLTQFGGVTTPVPVATRGVPFDVDLGPDQNGDTVAVYSRCSTEPGPSNPDIGFVVDDQFPQWSTGRGCSLYSFNFVNGRETVIAAANSPRASQFLPSVWKAQIAFARTYPRKRGVAGQRAYFYIRPLVGAGHSRRLPAGRRGTVRTKSGQRFAEHGPTGVDLGGSRLAFSWNAGTYYSPTSAVYLDTIHRNHTRSKRLALTYRGSSPIANSELLSPAVDSGMVWWGNTLLGEGQANSLERYRIATGSYDVANIPSGFRDGTYAGPVLWTTVDASRFFYLASGVYADGAGCKPEQKCLTIRGSAPLTFVPSHRR